MWLTMIKQSQESAWADTDCSALWSPSSMGLTAGPSRSIRPTFMDIHTNLAGHSEMDKIIDDYLWRPSTVTSAVHNNKTVWQPSNCNLTFISKSLVMRTFVHTSDNHGKSFCKANLNAIRGWPPRPHVLADVADVTYAAMPAAENIRSLRKTTAGWIQITAWGKELDDCVRVIKGMLSSRVTCQNTYQNRQGNSSMSFKTLRAQACLNLPYLTLPRLALPCLTLPHLSSPAHTETKAYIIVSCSVEHLTACRHLLIEHKQNRAWDFWGLWAQAPSPCVDLLQWWIRLHRNLHAFMVLLGSGQSEIRRRSSC